MAAAAVCQCCNTSPASLINSSTRRISCMACAMVGAHMPTEYPAIRELALKALIGEDRPSTLKHARDTLKHALQTDGNRVDAYNVFARNFITQLKCVANVPRIISVRGLSYRVNEEALVDAARLMLASGAGDSAYTKIVAGDLLAALEAAFTHPAAGGPGHDMHMAAVRLLADAFGPLTLMGRLPVRIRDDIDATQPIADEDEQQTIGRRREQSGTHQRYNLERISELIASALVYERLARVEDVAAERVIRSLSAVVDPSDSVLSRAAADAMYTFYSMGKIRTPARKNITLQEYARASPPLQIDMLQKQFAFLFANARAKIVRGKTTGLTKKFSRIFKRTCERLSRIIDYSGVARSVAVFLIKILVAVARGDAQSTIQAYDRSVSGGLYELESAASADTTLEEQQIGYDEEDSGEQLHIGSEQQQIDDEEQQIDASLFSRAKEAVTGRASGKRYRITVMADELVARIALTFRELLNSQKPITTEELLPFISEYTASVARMFNVQAQQLAPNKQMVWDVVGIMARGFARGPLPVPPSRREMLTMQDFAGKRRRVLDATDMAQEFANVVLYYVRGQRTSTVVGAPQGELAKRAREITADMQSLYRKAVREVQRVPGVNAPDIVAKVLLAIFTAMSGTPYDVTYEAPTRRSVSPLRRLSPTRWFRSTEAAPQ